MGKFRGDTGGPGAPGTCGHLFPMPPSLPPDSAASLHPGLERARKELLCKPGRSPITPEDTRPYLPPKPFLWALVESGFPIPSSKFGCPSTSPLLELAHLLGDDRVVEQGVPTLLNFPKGETTAELHTQVDGCQVIGLQDPDWFAPVSAMGRILPLEAIGSY